MAYRTYICGDGDCPHDPDFEHRFYFGCVPADFRERTGRSKRYRQPDVQARELAQLLRHPSAPRGLS